VVSLVDDAQSKGAADFATSSALQSERAPNQLFGYHFLDDAICPISYWINWNSANPTESIVEGSNGSVKWIKLGRQNDKSDRPVDGGLGLLDGGPIGQSESVDHMLSLPWTAVRYEPISSWSPKRASLETLPKNTAKMSRLGADEFCLRLHVAVFSGDGGMYDLFDNACFTRFTIPRNITNLIKAAKTSEPRSDSQMVCKDD
jgi:hypothetical protein